MKRSEMFDDFAKAHVYLDEGLSLRTDGEIERLWNLWISRGCPQDVTVGIDAEMNAQSDASAVAELFAEERRYWIRKDTIDVTALF